MKTFKEIFNEAMGKTLASGLFMAQTQVPHRHSTEEPKKSEQPQSGVDPNPNGINRSPPPQFGGRRMVHARGL